MVLITNPKSAMHENPTEENNPKYARNHLTLIAVTSVVVLALLCIFYVLADQSISFKPADDRVQLFDPKGVSMSELIAKAEAGNIFAQQFLVESYRDGTRGFTKDHALRFKWALKAAQEGQPWARIECGICYFHGFGTQKDFTKSFEMFNVEATASGDPLAQMYMGWFMSGKCGFPRRDELAAEWFRKSAEQGDVSGKTMYGIVLLYGQGITKNPKEAIKYLSAGVDGGNARAMAVLGHAYYSGNGVAKDLKEAVRLYRRAADKLDPFGCINLGLLYLNGDGVIKDVEEALKLFKIASADGNVEAKKNLAYIYHYGNGVEIDLPKASNLYLEVARSGDVECQRLTGVRYQQGIGFKVDLIEAYAWYNISASMGDAQSAKLREELSVSLSPLQVIAAQKRSRELLAEIDSNKSMK